MSGKQKYPRADALAVAKELCDALRSVTERLIVAGSLRRRKQEVGDVEILFVPRFEKRALDFFMEGNVSLADEVLSCLLQKGIIQQRTNVNGSEMWGAKNKLAMHVASKIPVDFFAANHANWFNYLVCRTGGKDSNMQIATAAQAIGWKWNPYGVGFTDRAGNIIPVACEEDVFRLTGQKWREPWERL